MRTIHQILVAVLLAYAPVVALLDLPAEKAAQVSAVLVVLVGVVAKVYNVLFPAEAPLDDDPRD